MCVARFREGLAVEIRPYLEAGLLSVMGFDVSAAWPRWLTLNGAVETTRYEAIFALDVVAQRSKLGLC